MLRWYCIYVRAVAAIVWVVPRGDKALFLKLIKQEDESGIKRVHGIDELR